MDILTSSKVLCFRISDYDDLAFCPLFFLKDHYFFRGQADAKWGLQTSLERKYSAYCKEWLKSGSKEHNIPDNEKKFFVNAFSQTLKYKEEYAAIQTFRRLTSLPEKLTSIEILARMQHYGAATRLLDVTTSFLIALFFAFEEYGEQDRTVWIFNGSFFYKNSGLIDKMVCFDLEDEKNEAFLRLMSNRENRYHQILDHANNYIYPSQGYTSKKRSIMPLEITGNNPRLVAQNGAFLFPTQLNKSFEDNLCTVLDMAKEDFSAACKKALRIKIKNFDKLDLMNAAVIKLIIPVKIRHLAERLFNAANISYQSIYPDEIGIAKSIKYW